MTEDHCPECGSGDISWGRTNRGNDWIGDCNNCGCRFVENVTVSYMVLTHGMA